MHRLLHYILFTGLLCASITLVTAQVRVSGKVFDITHSVPLEAVSVLSTSGNGTITDSSGHYTIIVHADDSVWFSYLNKPTVKYPVKNIPNIEDFEIALHVNASDLRPVNIMPPDYRQDSIQNREDYAKIFNYKKPGIDASINPNGGVGLDLDQFINMFHFQRNKRMLLFQQQLLRQEKEKYIDHRFSRALVIRLTKLHGPLLDTFMLRYRPSLEFTEIATEYEFQLYIKKCYENYRQYLHIVGELNKEDE